MPSPTSRSRDLRETTLRLISHLDRVVTAQSQRRVITHEEISLLLSELMSTGTNLRANPLPGAGSDADLDHELEQYRMQVERLRAFLPSIHEQLLAERTRLEAQQSRIVSAAEWARTSQQTL